MSSAKRNLLDIRKPRKDARSRATARDSMESLLPERSARPLRLKDRRRRQRILYACGIVVATAAAVGALGGVTHLEKLAIKSVTVFGAQELSTDALVAAVNEGLSSDGFEFFSRKNMFLYPREGIEQSLFGDFPRIKHVNVKREALLSQAVIVTVEERVPHALWCAGSDEAHASSTPNGCYFLDASGYIFATEERVIEPRVPTLPFVFRGGLVPDEEVIGQYFLRGRLHGVVSLLKKLQRAGFAPLGLTVVSEKDFTVPLLEGPYLYASFETDSSVIVERLESALQAEGMREGFEKLDYIDLRFGNKVYYK